MSFFKLPRAPLRNLKDFKPSNLSSLAQPSHGLNYAFTPLLHDIAMKDFEQLPALCWAAQQGHEPLARLLLKKGVGVDAAEPETGMTALMFAACNGYIGTARLLVEEGAKLDRLDKEKRNPLVWAVKKRRIGAVIRTQNDPPPNISLVELLLEKGAHVDGLNTQGETALYAVARSFDYQGNLLLLYSNVTKLLLNAGADANFRAFIQQHEVVGDAVLHMAVQSSSVEFIKVLLEGGADVNILGFSGDAPLRLAVRCGNPIIVAALLENRAEAIHSYLSEVPPFGNPWIKELLLQYGAREDQLQ